MKSTNAYHIRLLTPSLLALCIFSAQNINAYECVVDTNGDGNADGTASSTSNGTQSIACGTSASAGGFASTALGRDTSAGGDYSVVLGSTAQGISHSAVAIGLNAVASGVSSTALGQGSHAEGEFSMSIGREGYSFGTSSTALGRSANTWAQSSIALGAYSSVSPGANYGIAIGTDVNGDNLGARARAVGAISLGNDVENDVPNSMKIAVPLRIQADAGTAQLLVDEASATTAVRSLIKMKNNGAVGFEMEDTNQGTWQFRTSSSGAFIMNKLGNTGSEATVFDNGNATFKGTVRANGVLLTSSRASKTDFSAIKPNEVMQKLAKMNVEEWRYKEADKNDRHISPMAEDFYSLFKLGADNTGINPNDLASVAIIAAKELQKKATLAELENLKLKQQLEEKTMALETKNKMLQERLASLEKLVTNLASSSGRINRSGAKVALK